jgi:hypothetical protein
MAHKQNGGASGIPPSTRIKSLIGAAGVHFVAAELSRRGMIALPTTRNTAGYDLIVTSTDGKHHANIQVKTSRSSVRSWVIQADYKHCGNQDYFVLVRWAGDRFEAFMLNGAEAKIQFHNCEKRQGGKPDKKYFPVINFKYGHEKGWLRRWQEFDLN